MKNAGALLFLAVAVGFLGFEIYAAGRNSYRMEPEYVYSAFVKAARAVEACGALTPVDAATFHTNLGSARQRAMRSLQETEGLTANDSDAAASALSRTARSEVDDLVASAGCDHTEVWKLRKHYEFLSR